MNAKCPAQIIELELPALNGPHTQSLQNIIRHMGRIGTHLSEDTFHLERLVVVQDHLMDAWSPWANHATAYAYRLHLAPLYADEWQALVEGLLRPLSTAGVSIRRQDALAA